MAWITSAIIRCYKSLQEFQGREKKFLLEEILQIKGLMPLLMKPRNGENWTVADREELRQHFQRISRISPYVIVLILPGSFLVLPILAWWLDRRRNNARELRRNNEQTDVSK